MTSTPPTTSPSPARPPYRLAAFDFDGTLADSLGWLAGVWGEVADRYRFRRLDAAEIEALRGLDARRQLARVGLPLWKVPFVARHVRRLMARDAAGIRLFDGVRDLLAGLAAAGVTVAVVSSNAEANVRAVLGPADAGRVAYYGCGAGLFGKRRKLAAALRACGARPAEAIYVGDEVRDVVAARGLGMAAGAVTWGFATAAALAAAGPTETFASPREVLRRLAGEG